MRLRAHLPLLGLSVVVLPLAMIACGASGGGGATSGTDAATEPTDDETRGEDPTDAGRGTDARSSSDATTDPPNDAGKKDAKPPVDSGPPGKRVFLTSNEYRADLKGVTGAASGVAGADAICNLLAQAQGLGGTWTAWISDSTTNAIDRVQGQGPWYRMDGQMAFLNRANLQTGAKIAISIDEKGKSWVNQFIHGAWTGTVQLGTRTNYRCTDWTSSAHVNDGTVGDITSAARWTADALDYCDYPHHLYCFEN